ncbi:hypothetical protein DL95DRAFT_396377 [Leptodontidium sp. 2 PMI_412]|nr:hypothetical protein DL95DRAFT_396377 [Leptodontidium sp. 2 PMI_412]
MNPVHHHHNTTPTFPPWCRENVRLHLYNYRFLNFFAIVISLLFQCPTSASALLLDLLPKKTNARCLRTKHKHKEVYHLQTPSILRQLPAKQPPPTLRVGHTRWRAACRHRVVGLRNCCL